MTNHHGTTTAEGHWARLRRNLGDAGPLIALIVLALLFTVANPKFVSPTNIAMLLSQMAIPLVIASALTFVILLGSIDLSVEGAMAVTGMAFVLTAENDRNSLNWGVGSIAFALCVGLLFGAITGFLHVRLMIPSFMTTLGMGAVGIGIATVLFGGRAPRLMDPALKAIGTGKTLGVANIFWVALIMFAIAYAIQRMSKLGRYAYVIGGDEAVAKLSGINTGKYKMAIFAFAGLFYGVAGVLVASQLGVGSPTSSQGFMFTSITAVVLGGTLLTGGKGSVVRSLIGVAIIAVLANGLILMNVSTYVQIALQGLVIIVAVVVTGWRLRERVRVIK